MNFNYEKGVVVVVVVKRQLIFVRRLREYLLELS